MNYGAETMLIYQLAAGWPPTRFRFISPPFRLYFAFILLYFIPFYYPTRPLKMGATTSLTRLARQKAYCRVIALIVPPSLWLRWRKWLASRPAS